MNAIVVTKQEELISKQLKKGSPKKLMSWQHRKNKNNKNLVEKRKNQQNAVVQISTEGHHKQKNEKIWTIKARTLTTKTGSETNIYNWNQQKQNLQRRGKLSYTEEEK